MNFKDGVIILNPDEICPVLGCPFKKEDIEGICAGKKERDNIFVCDITNLESEVSRTILKKREKRLDKKGEVKLEDKNNKRKSLREIVSKIFLAQPVLGMKSSNVSEFLKGNFDTKVDLGVIESYLSKNNLDGLIDEVVDEMMKGEKEDL